MTKSKWIYKIPDLGDSMSVVPALKIETDVLNTKQGKSIIEKANVSNESVKDLFRRYMQKLTDDKLMLKLSEIKKLDILDITSFAALPEDGHTMPVIPDATAEERKAIERLNWYSIVPCFEYGAIKVNKFRYIVFELREIDPEEKTVSMRLYDYMRIEGIWQTGVSTTVKAKDFHEVDKNIAPSQTIPNTHHIVINHSEDLNFEELYTMYNAKELGWTKEQYELWIDVVVRNSRLVTENMIKKYNTNQCEQLANIFFKIISRCNAMLEMNKPSRPAKKKSEGTPQGKRTVSYESGKAPERKIRNVGILRVQSKDIPRKPCLETVITYKVAKWTVRGHVRRYKSGKEVYIKPGVRKRKALTDTGQMTATTIRFRKKKKDNTTQGQE